MGPYGTTHVCLQTPSRYKIPNNIGIRYYVIMYFLPPFFIATTPPNMAKNYLAPTHDIFRAIEKSTLKILILCDFVDQFLQGLLQVSGGFRRGDS